MSSIDTILGRMTGKAFDQTGRAPVTVVSLWRRACRWYLRWSEFHRTRAQLRNLTDSELADIGISREQADAEANSPMRFRF